MAQTIEQILGGINLCGVIQATTTGIPDVWEPGFYEGVETVNGDTGAYTRITGTRTTARIAAYGSPSQQRQLKDIARIPAKLIHSIESIYHNPAVLTNLLNYNNLSVQRLGIAEVARQTKEFRQNFDNLRIATLTSMLATGGISFDGSGNFLPSTTGASFTISYGVPTNNTGQLMLNGTNTIITSSWTNTTGVNMFNQLAQLKKYARQITGYPVERAYYGANVIDYVLGQGTVKSFLDHNPTANEHVKEYGTIPDRFAGIEWRPAADAFFEDANGSNQPLWDDDTILFCPKPSAEWIGWLEGTYPIPSSVYGNVSSDGAAAMNTLSLVTGMFSYGMVLSDPVTVKQVAGDTFLPVLKVPKAIFIAKVKF